MARFNLTGFTSAHVRGNNRRGVIGLSNLLKDLLIDQGHEADYGLENPDYNIVCVLDPSSINASNTVEALKLLKQDNCILAFDDWQIRGFYKTIDNIVDNKKFSKTHHTVKYDELIEQMDSLRKIKNGEYKVIYPAYKTGDHDLLEIRGEKFCIDPSMYIYKERPFETEVSGYKHHLIPVHASLATKWKDLEKRKYTVLNVRNENEQAVFEYYCRHRMVISPEHYFTYRAGWFRNRYALANLARAVVIEENNSCFGESYAVDRKNVTEKNIDDIFEMQNEAYLNTIMDKEEIKENLNKVIEAMESR